MFLIFLPFRVLFIMIDKQINKVTVEYYFVMRSIKVLE